MNSANDFTTDAQYLAFRDDIVAHPDDNTPRLILADFLEDTGQAGAGARAEFIRVQIELTQNPPLTRRRELLRRERELLLKNERDWLKPLKGMISEADWQRGFVHKIKLGIRQFFDNAEIIFREAPVLYLQLLRINQTKLTIEEIAQNPHLQHVRGLSLSGSSIGDQKLAQLLQLGSFENLASLCLSGCFINQRTLAALRDTSLPRLQILDLSGNTLTGSLSTLFQPTFKSQLKDLNLRGTSLTNADVQHLCQWKGCASIETLDISNSYLGVEGTQFIANSANLSSVRKLILWGCSIGLRAMQALMRSTTLSRLHHLDLAYNNLRASSIQTLFSTTFSELKTLSLVGNLIEDLGALDLRRWKGLSHLEELDLSQTNLSDEGVAALIDSGNLQSLRRLSLNVNFLSNKTAEKLASAEDLKSLERLELTGTQITVQGVNALLESPNLQNLVYLHLGGFRTKCEALDRRFPDARTLY